MMKPPAYVINVNSNNAATNVEMVHQWKTNRNKGNPRLSESWVWSLYSVWLFNVVAVFANQSYFNLLKILQLPGICNRFDKKTKATKFIHFELLKEFDLYATKL